MRQGSLADQRLLVLTPILGSSRWRNEYEERLRRTLDLSQCPGDGETQCWGMSRSESLTLRICHVKETTLRLSSTMCEIDDNNIHLGVLAQGLNVLGKSFINAKALSSVHYNDWNSNSKDRKFKDRNDDPIDHHCWLPKARLGLSNEVQRDLLQGQRKGPRRWKGAEFAISIYVSLA